MVEWTIGGARRVRFRGTKRTKRPQKTLQFRQCAARNASDTPGQIRDDSAIVAPMGHDAHAKPDRSWRSQNGTEGQSTFSLPGNREETPNADNKHKQGAYPARVVEHLGVRVHRHHVGNARARKDLFEAFIGPKMVIMCLVPRWTKRPDSDALQRIASQNRQLMGQKRLRNPQQKQPKRRD